MARTTVDSNLATLVLQGSAQLHCNKCGASSWALSSPANQSKFIGYTSLSCKPCAAAASMRSKKKRAVNDPSFLASERARLAKHHVDKYASDASYRESRKASTRKRYAEDSDYREYCKTYKAKRRASDPVHMAEYFKRASLARKKRYAEDPAYRQSCISRGVAYTRNRLLNDAVYKANRNSYYVERYATNTTHREACKLRSLLWAKTNRGKCNAYNAKYRAAKKQATPPWSETAAIAEFYMKCPEGMHVDHIYPLVSPLDENGKEIGNGLHVKDNLQYLPASENLSKSNKWPKI